MEVEKQIREIIEFYCGGTYENRNTATKEILQICQNLQLLQTGVMARCNIDLIGKELEYISPITKAKTKFKVADVFVNIFNVGLKERQVYGEVFAVSENGNKYKIDEFSEVRIPQ